MTPYEVLTGVGVLLGVALGVFNYLDKRRGTDQNEVITQANYLKTTNEAIRLANERALSAEIRADLVEKRLSILDERLSYRITFDVLLGSNPIVENVTISRYPTDVTPAG